MQVISRMSAIGTKQTMQPHQRLSAFGQQRTKVDFGLRRSNDPKRTLVAPPSAALLTLW